MQENTILPQFLGKNITSMQNIKKQIENSNSAYLIYLGPVNEAELLLLLRRKTFKYDCEWCCKSSFKILYAQICMAFYREILTSCI